MLTNYSSLIRGRAEAKFKKIQSVQDGVKAITEYEAEALAVRERTVQLRTLRLAKEAADVAIEVKKKPVTQRRTSSL